MSATTSKSALVPDESSATLDASHGASNDVPPQPASRSNAAGQRTPLETGSHTVGSASSPRKLDKPGLSAEAHTHESLREDDRDQQQKWAKMGQEKFIRLVSVDELLDTMPSSGEGEKRAVELILEAVGESLTDATKKLKRAKNEDQTSKPLFGYLETVFAEFPEDNQPYIDDTHNTVFEAVISIEHDTKPDLTSSRPGVSLHVIEVNHWRWIFAGLVIELKFKVDIFDEHGKIKQTAEAQRALRQIMKSARSLLMTHHSCHVYVIAVFRGKMTRIFRFDRGGFIATQAFDWLREQEAFVTFLYRLYNSNPGGMLGDDDTVSIPLPDVKEKIFKRVKKCYPKMSKEDATHNSLCMKVVLFDEAAGADRESHSKVVNCFTFGPPLSVVDSLFGRATHVYTVILENDLDDIDNSPEVRALKDSWRQAIRRPELDFYDAIEYHCLNAEPPVDMKGMARCRGSVDLFESKKSLGNWDSTLHRTLPLELEDSARHHMRTLLTPVGAPLRTFSSTRNLVQALYSVVLHLERAYEAGILHRDVSEGNALLQESSPTKGFLLDWDYAEFTPEGLVKFHEAFPDRVDDSNKYQAIPKSLKDLTGTPPFMAIEILKAYQNQQDSQSLNTDETGDVENGSVNGAREEEDSEMTDGAGTEGTCVGADAMEMIKDEDGVAKDAEVVGMASDERGGDEQDVLATEIASTALTHSLRHDLESVYWLLVWMILRHTKHGHPGGVFACVDLFAPKGYGMKNSWVRDTQFRSMHPLFQLAEVLRFYVAEQYPTERPFPLDPIRPTYMTIESVRAAFERCLELDWGKAEPARLYIPPITNSANNKAPQATQSLRRKIATDNLLSLGSKARSAPAKGSKAESATSAGSKRGRPIEEEPPVELVAAETGPRRSKRVKASKVSEGQEIQDEAGEGQGMEVDSAPSRVLRSAKDKEKQKAGAKSSKATGTKAQAKKQAPSTRGNNRTGSSNRKRKD